MFDSRCRETNIQPAVGAHLGETESKSRSSDFPSNARSLQAKGRIANVSAKGLPFAARSAPTGGAFQSQALSRCRGHARSHRRGFKPCHAPGLPEKASKHG